jgi:hypothetical protein
MQRHLSAVLLLCSLLVGLVAYAQRSETTGPPVWTMEFIKVRPGQFGPTLGYLDDHWMHVRKEAKRQGAVLSYHRFADAVYEPGNADQDILLVTEYRNFDAYTVRENLFASIAEHLPSLTPGVIKPQKEELYEIVDIRLFLEEPEADGPILKLLAKQ